MKPCEKVPAEHLLAYHLNALSPLRKLQLTWHLKGCADCRTSLLAEQALDSHLRRGENITRPVLIPAPSRQLALRLGGAALALTVLVAGAVFLHPGTPGGPQIAFADVEKALSDSRYITWTQAETSTTIRAPKTGQSASPRTRTSRSTYWVEVNPLRMAIRENATGAISLYDSDHYEGTVGDSHYIWARIGEWNSPDMIRQLVVSPLDANYSNNNTRGMKSHSTPWEKKTVTFQGKTAVHFSRTTTLEIAMVTRRIVKREQVWVDPASRHLLRRETASEHHTGYTSVSVAENFRYLNSAPPETFSPSRPEPGEFYTFSLLDGPTQENTVDQKTDRSIRKQISQIATAINAGNADGLAALGSPELYANEGPEVFNGKTRAQRAAYFRWYLKYVARQKMLRNWKLEPLPARFTSRLGHWHRQGEDTAYPPTGPRDVALGLLGTATLPNGQRKRILSHVTFRLTPSGPKITWFNPHNKLFYSRK